MLATRSDYQEAEKHTIYALSDSGCHRKEFAEFVSPGHSLEGHAVKKASLLA
jgi:hypothetical protein